MAEIPDDIMQVAIEVYAELTGDLIDPERIILIARAIMGGEEGG